MTSKAPFPFTSTNCQRRATHECQLSSRNLLLNLPSSQLRPGLTLRETVMGSSNTCQGPKLAPDSARNWESSFSLSPWLEANASQSNRSSRPSCGWQRTAFLQIAWRSCAHYALVTRYLQATLRE